MSPTNEPFACPVPEKAVDRRDFLTWIAAGSLAVTGAFSLATIVQIIQPPRRSIEGKTKIGPMKVGTVSGLEPGKPKIVEYGDDFLWLVKLDAKKVIGLNAACPHVACKLPWVEKTKQYDCPCHASSFTIQGKRLFGPAPRDMFAANLEFEGDDIIMTGFEV